MLNLKQAFRFGIEELKGFSPTFQLDAKILLSFALNVRDFLFLEENRTLTQQELENFKSYLERRKTQEPVAYITGKKEFFGIEFDVSPAVLIPRPESEILVEEAVKIITKEGLKKAIDVCTGSGCIGISIIHEKPDLTLTVIDVSPFALEIAKKNAKNIVPTLDISFIKADFLNSSPLKAEIIVSNPPYIKAKDVDLLDETVKNFEPKLALDGGFDGLIFYRKLALCLSKFILVEIGAWMEEDIKEIFALQNWEFEAQIKDIAGIVRVLIFKKNI
jgi:release factor glutamine methyltransferase